MRNSTIATRVADHRPSTRSSRAHGFTLVELLVVIGIVSLLVSILLPALSKARSLARQAQCLSNLRQIGQLLHMYANDNKGMMPGLAGSMTQGLGYGDNNCYLYSNYVNVDSLYIDGGNGTATGMGLVIKGGYLAMGDGVRTLYCPGRGSESAYSYENNVGPNTGDVNEVTVVPTKPSAGTNAAGEPWGFYTRKSHWCAFSSYNVLNSSRGYTSNGGNSMSWNLAPWAKLGTMRSDTPMAFEVFGLQGNGGWSPEGWLKTNHGKGYNIMAVDGSAAFYPEENDILETSFSTDGWYGASSMNNHCRFAGAGFWNSIAWVKINRWGYSIGNEGQSGIAWIEYNLLGWSPAEIQGNTPD